MPRLSLKYKEPLMGICMAVTMSSCMSAVILLQRQGLIPEFFDIWLQSTLQALPFSVVIGITCSTLYNKILDKLLFTPRLKRNLEIE